MENIILKHHLKSKARCLLFLFIVITISLLVEHVYASDITWKSESNIESNNLNSIVYGNGLYVTVGDNGTIYISEDGETWTKQSTDSNANLIKVIHNKDTFIAIGNNGDVIRAYNRENLKGTILVSKDGEKWTNVCPDYILPEDIIWNGKEYITVGLSLKEHKPRLIEKDFEVFDTYGSIIKSSDGLNWKEVSEVKGGAEVFANVKGIAYNGKKYILIAGYDSSRYVFESTDLLKWNSLIWDINMPTYESILWDGEKYVASVYKGAILFSKDGQKWDKKYFSHTGLLKRLKYVGNKYILTGYDGKIIVSDNLSNWRELVACNELAKEGITARNSSLNDIVRGKDKWVAIGGNNAIVTSSDMIEWKTVLYKPEISISDIAWTGEQFVAIGEDLYDEYILRSSDGTSWDIITKFEDWPINTIQRILYMNDKYYLFNVEKENIYVMESEDCIEWRRSDNINEIDNDYNIDSKNVAYIIINNEVYAFGNNSLKLIDIQKGIDISDFSHFTYDGQYYVAVGRYNPDTENIPEIMRTRDFIHWEFVKSEQNTKVAAYITKLEYAGGKYFGLSWSSGQLYISEDLKNWTKRKVSNKGILDVIWNGQYYLLVGEQGTALKRIR